MSSTPDTASPRGEPADHADPSTEWHSAYRLTPLIAEAISDHPGKSPGEVAHIAVERIIDLAESVPTAAPLYPATYAQADCGECGPDATTDEDGCCVTCGRDCARVYVWEPDGYEEAAPTPPLASPALTVGAALADPRVQDGSHVVEYELPFTASPWGQVRGGDDGLSGRTWRGAAGRWRPWQFGGALRIAEYALPCRLAPLASADLPPDSRAPLASPRPAEAEREGREAVEISCDECRKPLGPPTADEPAGGRRWCSTACADKATADDPRWIPVGDLTPAQRAELDRVLTPPIDMPSPEVAAALLDHLRNIEHRPFTNPFGDRVWLKPCLDEDGKRTGLTECCLVEEPCENHAAMPHGGAS